MMGPSQSTEKSNPREFGHGLLDEFSFKDGWRNLNHASYGATPKVVCDKRTEYQDKYEGQPDYFIRHELGIKLRESRQAVADFVNAPVKDIVYVSNATDGINTVLRNLKWNDDGKDVMISFGTIYDACARAQDFVVDYSDGKVTARDVLLEYPLEDEEILQKVRDLVKEIEGEGKRVRLALFDIVSSSPGIRFPWEDMTALCRELGVLSLVDGAQGIGMIPLDLKRVDPDFLVTNCHKWLHVPRACAVFYVPERNQHLIPTTLATSRGYLPQRGGRDARAQPLPSYDDMGHFAFNFEWVGMKDDSPYLTVVDAIAWRRDVLGGEERILKYLWDLNKRGIQRMADLLGTEVLENKAGTLTNCAMGNVGLPLWVKNPGEDGKRPAKAPEGHLVLTHEEAVKAFYWMEKTSLTEYKTFMAPYVRWNRFWARVSAQVYLEMEDYEWAAGVWKELLERVKKGEYRDGKE